MGRTVTSIAGLHAAAVALFDLGAEGFGKELPVGFVVEILGPDAAEAACLFVGEEEAPIVVEDEHGIGEAGEHGAQHLSFARDHGLRFHLHFRSRGRAKGIRHKCCGVC
jgi:hypothetical protein